MKRLILLCLILTSAACASAQRFVINVSKSNGQKERLDTRRVEEIDIANATDSVTAFTKGGQVKKWPIEDFGFSTFEKLPPHVANSSQTVENDHVHRYITETDYDLTDYEYTNVLNYADHSLALDEPHPIVITMAHLRPTRDEYILLSEDEAFTHVRREEFVNDSLKIWNATPGESIYYRVMSGDSGSIVQEGVISVTGRVRMIYAPSVNNIRDLGGWPVEGGGHIRYGRLYRGAKFHDAKQDYLSTEDSLRLRELNIKCEFDLRGSTEANGANPAYSRLGDDVAYRIVPHGMYAYVNAVKDYPEYFRFGWNQIKNYIFNGDPIFIHCSHGCDRMGTWAAVLEGVLGVSENNINLDYELSAFAPKSSLWRYRNMHQTVPDYDFRQTMNYLRSLPGETFKDKCEYLLVTLARIPQTDIDRFREIMIER